MTAVNAGSKVRVVSYNIHSQRDDQSALTAVVRDLSPDVLIVQEAPRRLGWRWRCAALARQWDLVVAVGGAPGLGNLILTHLRVRVADVRCERFPFTPGRHLRGAVFARCAVPGVHFTVVGSHLATDPVERPQQAKLLAEWVAGLDAPVVLGADLNDQPGSPTWQALAGGLADPGEAAATFPSAAPRRRIDAVFTSPGVEVLSYQVVDSSLARRASDHLPVLAELRL